MTEKPVKLIGLDLDGTVFNNEKVITKETQEAIQFAIGQGVTVVPVTGRPLEGLPGEFWQMPGIEYAITSNGAKIYRLSDKEVLAEDLLEKETVLEVLKVLEKYPVVPDCFIDGRGNMPAVATERIPEMGLTPAMTQYLLSSRNFHKNLLHYIAEQKQKIEKVTINFYLDKDRKKLQGQQAEEKLRQIPGIQIVTGAIHNLEINTRTAAKGTALLKLGELLGIVREEIMACGDEKNDLDMIRKAGIGVAMENAAEEVKQEADFITKSNEEDGVAYAIRRFLTF